MNSEYKQKLLENAPIYVDCCQMLKCVYRLLFTMPKKDRVIVGDKIIENRNEYKRCTLFKRAVLDKFGKVIDWNEKKNAFKIKK